MLALDLNNWTSLARQVSLPKDLQRYMTLCKRRHWNWLVWRHTGCKLSACPLNARIFFAGTDGSGSKRRNGWDGSDMILKSMHTLLTFRRWLRSPKTEPSQRKPAARTTLSRRCKWPAEQRTTAVNSTPLGGVWCIGSNGRRWTCRQRFYAPFWGYPIFDSWTKWCGMTQMRVYDNNNNSKLLVFGLWSGQSLRRVGHHEMESLCAI